MPRPVNAPMTFGYGLMPTDKKAIEIYKSLGLKGHNGDDYAVSNVPTYAIVNGTVVTAGWVTDGGGNSVRIRFTWKDDREYICQHDHLSRVDVAVGQRVTVGQQVGVTGNTGASTGAHLHFAVRPASGYNPNDGYYGYISPAPFYEGDQDDMTYEEFAAAILDTIEDNPWYPETKKAAFDGHVAWLRAEHAKDPFAIRHWIKSIMGNNGVLNATLMQNYKMGVANEKTALQAQIDTANRTNAELRASVQAEAQKLTDKALESVKDEAFKAAYRTQAGENPPAKDIEAWKLTDLSVDEWIRRYVPNASVKSLQEQLDASNASVRRLNEAVETQTGQLKDLAGTLHDLQEQVGEIKQHVVETERQLADERATSEGLRNQLEVERAKTKPVDSLTVTQLLRAVIDRVLKGGG